MSVFLVIKLPVSVSLPRRLDLCIKPIRASYGSTRRDDGLTSNLFY